MDAQLTIRVHIVNRQLVVAHRAYIYIPTVLVFPNKDYFKAKGWLNKL